ncbi:hypothetical protein D4R52_02245 [bacterium]|nr:MAG: hypothetical protein D4R52_02245 [bacterium]
MAKTIAEQLVALGLVSAECAEKINKQTEKGGAGAEVVKAPKRLKNNQVPGFPSLRICQGCGEKYEYRKRNEYPGKSNRRCPKCQLRRKKGTVATNLTMRPGGHKTRQQHKRVCPAKE